MNSLTTHYRRSQLIALPVRGFYLMAKSPGFSVMMTKVLW